MLKKASKLKTERRNINKGNIDRSKKNANAEL
jgi:hypothetical protein